VAIAPKNYSRQAIIDVGRSLQKLVLRATKMNVATCWIGPGADQKSVEAALGSKFNEETDHIICVCALGYASSYLPTFINLAVVRSQRNRLPLNNLFFVDKDMSCPVECDKPPFDAYRKVFEVCQWSPSSFNGQTTRCRAVLEEESDSRTQVSRFDFFCHTTSKYYAPVALGIWLANFEVGCRALKLDGRFSVVNENDRELSVPSSSFHYDISWIQSPP